MIILGILLNAAILWVILYFIVGEHSVPSFKPLIILLLFCSLIGFILSSLLGDIAILINFVIYCFALIFFFHIELKHAVISLLIFQAVSYLISFLLEAIFY